MRISDASVNLRRWLALSVVGISSLVGAPAEWRQLEGNGFTLLSDAPPRDLESFALTYSAFRQVLTVLLVPDHKTLVHSTVVLFRSERDLAQHVPASDWENAKIKAFSLEIDGAPLVAMSIAGNWTLTLPTAFESETMWTLRRLGYRLPIWMSQGAGQVMSTLRLHKDVCIFGEDDDRFRIPLRRRTWLPWDRFFEIDVGSPEYIGPSADGLYHAQAWALMHWLLLKDESGRERFMKLAESWRETGSVVAVPAIMQHPLAGFNKEIERYIQRKAQVRRIPFDTGAVRSALKIQTADTVRLEVCLATLLEQKGSMVEADTALRRAEAVSPDSPLLREALARRALREGRTEEALARYREAIAAGTPNPQPYLTSANARLDESSVGGVDYPGGGASNVAEALVEIRKALALDPGNAAAYRALGRAHFVAPRVGPDALIELEAGIIPGADGAQIRLYQALIQERLGRIDDHLTSLASIVSDLEIPVNLRNRAAQRWQQSATRAAEQFAEREVNEGRHLEARDHVKRRRASAEALGLPTAPFEPMLEWIDENEQLARLKTLYDGKRWVEFAKEAEAYLATYSKATNAPRIRTYLAEVQKILALPVAH